MRTIRTKDNSKSNHPFKVGDIIQVSPELTSLKEWTKGTVIKIFKNPFLGDEIAIKNEKGEIFFGVKEYFKTL